MIAGNDGDIGWRPQLVQPRLRPHIFGRNREIDEVAGHRDMVGRGRLQVARQRLDHLAAVDKFALAVPIDEAEAALAGELLEPRPRGKMQIGEVAEHEHRGMMLRESCREQWRNAAVAVHELPMRMPTTNTSTPPTTTWKAACRNGVSM